MPKPPRTDDPDQSQRFIQAARKLGCDENEDAFKTRLNDFRQRGARLLTMAENGSARLPT
jgi:hypothetical protein